MRAAVDADEPPTRGKPEEKLFATYSRSVVLVVLPDGLGSGAVISKDGTIVTNNHVVEGFKTVGVIFKPTRAGSNPRIAEAVEAKVLYADEIADLAIIKVAKLPADVKPFALGDHRKLAVGADVHAIGHPIGESWSYTKGVVSQMRPDYEWRYETGPQHRADVIQTQTPINPGNSGGPLLNDAGEIVGLNTFGGGRAQGINFAIAVTEIKRFVALRKNRRAPESSVADDTLPATTLPAAQHAHLRGKEARVPPRRARRCHRPYARYELRRHRRRDPDRARQQPRPDRASDRRQPEPSDRRGLCR
jgi:S1-C subfamily serine protease